MLLASGCARDPSPAAVVAQHAAMIDRYCLDCHNAAERAGDLSLERIDLADAARHAETFENMVRKLRGRLMPPPGNPQPAENELWGLVSWTERSLDAAAALTPRPGRVALQRLNRREYANAVRDLLAIEIDSTELLPQDDMRGGFDNVADALQVSPSFMEQYVAAARAVAVQAVGQPRPRPGSRTYNVRGTQQLHAEGLPPGTRGGLLVEHHFPAAGDYVINIGDMAQALWVYNMEFENTLIVTLNGERIYQTTIGGDEDTRSIDQDQDPAVDAINARLKNIRFRAPAGPQRVGVTFLRRTLAESDDRLRPFGFTGAAQDRVLRIPSFEISGPFDPQGLAATPSRQRIFHCYPEQAAEERACAADILARLARQAYRRPLNDADLEELMAYYDAGSAHAGFEEGTRAGLTGILASPFFLYRAERVPDALEPGEVYRIGDLELASKLSFFLWSTVPDEELLQLAVTGGLADPDGRARQVLRMLADPRAETLASDFAHQWLHLDHLAEVNPDGLIFPYASGVNDPRPLFLREITLFVDSVFRDDRSVIDLLNADYTYLNEPLASLYGVRGVKGEYFRRVELEHSARWGLLGKGAVLMVTSYPNRTAPVLRGAYVLENVLGTPPAPPLPDVEALPENQPVNGQLPTIRELMAQHSQDPLCFSCHGVMDPLGFALENFNAVGLWRERDRFAGVPVDASGQLPDGTHVNGPDELRAALLRRPEQFVQTLTERLLTYALGRELTYRDMPVVRRIVRQAAEQDYRFSSLVLGIVESEPFQLREAPDAG